MDQRVPKKLLVEHGAPTAADKRQIKTASRNLWVAALKPTTIGVPAFRDDVARVSGNRRALVDLAAGCQAGRLIELIHRAIPYPVLLVTPAVRVRHVVAGPQTLVAGRSRQGGAR